MDSIEWNGIVWRRRKDGYFSNSHRGGLLHRAVYVATHGSIPPGHLVHHVDHDKANNDPANLEAVTRKQHAALHAAEYVWTEERRIKTSAAIKAAREARPRRDACIICGIEFEHHGSTAARFCGQPCQREHYQAQRNGGWYDDAECVECGAAFKSNRHWGTKTCSRSCTARYAYRQRGARLRPDG